MLDSHLPNATEVSEIENIVELCRSWKQFRLGRLPHDPRRFNQVLDKARYFTWKSSFL